MSFTIIVMSMMHREKGSGYH